MNRPRLLPTAAFSLTLALSLLASACRMSEDSGSSSGGAERAEAPPVKAAPTAVAPAQPTTTPTALSAPSFLPTAPAPPAAGWNTTQIDWLPFDVATQRARVDHTPICLVVYTSWCPHCRNFSHVFEDPRVVERAHKFRMVRIDADQESEIATRFAPDGAYIPRTFFLSSDGVLDETIHLPRSKYQYFYDERDPGSIVAAMDKALQAKRL